MDGLMLTMILNIRACAIHSFQSYLWIIKSAGVFFCTSWKTWVHSPCKLSTTVTCSGHHVSRIAQRRLYFSDGLGMGRAMASLVAPWWWKGKISIQDGKATYNFHVADINTHCVTFDFTKMFYWTMITIRQWSERSQKFGWFPSREV